MIEYFIELFKKPKYLWTAIDELRLAGLIFALTVICLLNWFVVWLIIEKIKSHKYFNCKKEHCLCINGDNCLGCKKYKKRQKK